MQNSRMIYGVLIHIMIRQFLTFKYKIQDKLLVFKPLPVRSRGTIHDFEIHIILNN